MIYTSYFAKIRSLPENVEPVSIALWPPKWYSGLQYRKLAPTKEILDNWRRNKNKENYIRAYRDRVLNHLNPDNVVRELHTLTNKPDIALLCFEKPGIFCHRHLVAYWLNNHGIECLEWQGEWT